MPKYKYTATNAEGAKVRGTVEGDTPTGAGLALLERELQVTEIAESKSILQYEITKKRVPRKDIMHFSRQLAVFLRAGIPVVDALRVVREETTKKLFASLLDDMIESLQAGATLTRAASAHPEAFPEFYLGVLEASELSGSLDTALDEVADYMDRDLAAKQKIQSALFYPAIVFLMSIVTVVVLSVVVLPRFKTFFTELNAELPLPTRVLLAITDFMTGSWPFLLGGFITTVVGIFVALRTQRGRDVRDAIVLKIPVLGDLIQGAIVERFCRTLASMVRSGVSLPQALQVSSTGTSNAVYRKGLYEVRTAMVEGEGLAGPLARSGLFPGAARQMIRVGEETGTLDQQLETSAKYFARDLDFKITRFTNLFEPAVIIFMGLVVGFVAVALVSAMYGVFNSGTLS